MPFASLRRGLLIWLIVATVLIGVLALIDTRVEADRTSEQVSDRILAGSAMAIAEGITVDAMGGLFVMIRFSALDMLSSTAQNQDLGYDGPDSLTAITAEILLGALLRNLIENALLHCPAGSIVTLELRHLGDGLRIAVVDDGPPLPDAQFARLVAALEPHAQQDRRQSGRHGLGLQIVRDIATAIGGSLSVSRAEQGRGLRVVINLH